MHNKPSRIIPMMIGVLCLLLACPVIYLVQHNTTLHARSQTKMSDLALVEQSLRQFNAAQIAATRYRETSDPLYAEQVSEHLKMANEILGEMSDFDFRFRAMSKLTTGAYFSFDHNFRFTTAIQRESIRLHEEEWNKVWEDTLILLVNVISLLEKDEVERLQDTEQPSQDNPDLAELRKIFVETFRLALRQHHLASSNEELADELLRDMEQRCEKSVDWLGKLREQVVDEEEKKSITDAIKWHQWLMGMGRELSREYAAQRKRWEELDNIAARAEKFGNELFQNINR